MRSTSALSLLALVATVSAAPPSYGGAGSGSSIQNLKNKIKNVIVLVEENRSVDNLLGGQTIPGLDVPIKSGPYCNYYNVSKPWEGKACSHASDYNSVIDDPNHSVSGNNIEFYGTYLPDNEAIASGRLRPTMQGFADEEIHVYGSTANNTFLAAQVMNYYTEEQVSVLTALTKNFVTFNHWHSDIPGPTNPNRCALTSGTSAGKGANNFDHGSMMQRSIFQQVTELGKTWKNYYTDDTMMEATWYNWTYTTNHTDLVQPMANFFADAASGSLPDFTFLNPSCCGVNTTSMHPSGLISNGMSQIKQIYEAVRASPQWDQTLLILTFDETGGFHDHIAPPLAVRPDDLTYTETTPLGTNYTFHFDRLGGRLPTWLISPWVAGGFVEQQGRNSRGETVSYSATSILRTLGYLWDFEPFNPRVENAASVDHLVQQTMRKNTPQTLPEVYVW